MQPSSSERQLAFSAVLASTLALVACSTPPPTAELRSARDAVARAQYDGAGELAPQPLQAAQDKMTRAHAEVSRKEMEQAKNLAEEAQADADYADALAVAQKGTETTEQLQRLQRGPTATRTQTPTR